MRVTTMMAVALAALAGTTTGAAAQSLSEPQARSVLSESCSNISNLSRDPDGNWHGYCSKGAMMVDKSGKASPDTGAARKGFSEGQARSILLDACSNVSNLSEDKDGNWHGSCSKGAMMIDGKGQVVADKGGVGLITEAHARSIASEACGNVSSLHNDGAGTWKGACSKGNFSIDPAGKIKF